MATCSSLQTLQIIIIEKKREREKMEKNKEFENDHSNLIDEQITYHKI